MSRREEMRAQCIAYHKKHPRVWRLFDRFTRERIARGFRHYSGQAVFEQIRWHCDLPSHKGLSTFKINNNHVAFYTRAFMELNPEFAGFFYTRRQPSEQQPETGLQPLNPADFPTWPNEESARRIAPERINVGDLVGYSSVIGDPIVSGPHEVQAIDRDWNATGRAVAWIRGKGAPTGCVAIDALTPWRECSP